MYADVWIGSSVMTQQDSRPTGHRLGNSTCRNVAIREDQGTPDAISVEQFQAYDHLVATLYGCLHSNRGFDTFFLAFQAQFRNLQCAILGLSKHPTRMLYGWTHGYPPGFEQLFINSDLPEQDAALRHFSNLPPRQFDSLVGCDPNVYIGDLLTDATRAWVEAVGLGDSAGMLVSDADDSCVVFLANRHRDEGPYTRQELRQLNLLAAHIANAVRLYTKLYHAREDNESLVAALDHVSRPMIVFNEMAQVVKCNEAAESLLDTHPGLSVSSEEDPRLQSPFRRFNQKLNDAIITSIINARRGIRESIVLLHEYEGDCITLCITPLADDNAGSHGALAELYSKRLDVPVDRKKLRALFNCTETESRVAVNLMHGLDAREIAEREGITLNTARQHIKSLLTKNGFRRQAELVAALVRAVG